MYYIGLDVHKRKISCWVKDSSGKVYNEGWIPATRFDLDRWMKTLPQTWSAALEATMFSGWIYDHLKPHATVLKVAHPLMLRAIAAAKKKNDRIDANKICDCLRCDFLPECYMAPTAIRERRRTLRYRNLLVRQIVQMKIKISSLLMEAEVIDSTELAKRLSVPESWIRSRTNQKRTSDPIPHYRLGRYIRFSWGSAELSDWLSRQLVSTDRVWSRREL
jgi:transposase